MSLYFDSKVQFTDEGTISTSSVWHSKSPLLAVASYSQEKGGFVTIFDELGEPLEDINYPIHPVSQVTSLAWHPEKNILVTGWENGEIRIWNGSGAAKEFHNVNGPHTAPVNLLAFSEQGGRLVSGDTTGSLVGWKCDYQAQFLTSFHHTLKEPLTHLMFRISVQSKASTDLENLAKAAVNGDETALDFLSSWRPRTTARTQLAPKTKDNLCFFVATQSGIVYYINQSGSCMEVLNTEGSPLNYILYHPSNDSIVIMMEGLNIGHFSVDSSGNLNELTRVKLSGKTQALRGANSQGLVWVGNGALAILTGDMTVRVWDLDTGDNYLLPTEFNAPTQTAHANTELFTSIAYCFTNRTLCAGTNLGQLYIWVYKHKGGKSVFDNPEDNWILTNFNSIKGTIKQICWGAVNLRSPILGVNCITNVYVLKKQALCSFYCDDLWATQIGSSQILLQNSKYSITVNCDIQILGLCLNKNYLVISNGRTVIVYKVVHSDNKDTLTNLLCRVSSSFSCDSEKLLLYEQFIIVLTHNSTQLRSLSGIILNTIQGTDNEGEPIGMDLTDKYLTIFTLNGYVKVFDISNHEPKVITHAKHLYEMFDDFGEVICAKSNKTGTHIAMTIATSNLIPDGKLYVWNTEMESIYCYDFLNECVSDGADQMGVKLNPENSANENKTINKSIPLSFYWDKHEGKLLACETKLLNSETKSSSSEKRPMSSKTITHDKNDSQSTDSCITCFFTTAEGLVIMDRCSSPEGFLLSLSAPYIIVQETRKMHRVTLKHFIGLENSDSSVREAVLDFSYHLSIGNMDQAFKSIKLVHSDAIWNNLARMCVKTQRLDVALVCLGHMRNARAARVVRQAMSDPNLEAEAKVAVLAVQLNLLTEAEELYKSCNRWDLLNKLYQAQGKFDQAIKVAESNDRIHLRNTSFHYAQLQEKEQDIGNAIEWYQKATCNNQIPRLLMDNPVALHNFMEKTTDPEMLRWWAQYIESRGDVDRALSTYEKAEDYVSQVRLLCFMGLDSRAADVARTSNNKAACYELARHYETNDNADEAIQFFRRAQAYSMAMRICRERGMDDALWSLAGAAGQAHKAEAAEYFESLGDMPKAVSLYHRAGMIHKALELAFSSQQFDVLQDIAADLDASTDPELIAECAEYFSNNEQYERAVDLLAIANKFTDALDICLQHSVNISEGLAERLSPTKGTLDDEQRLQVLYRLAEVLNAQGDYHLATKKFTQAGDKIRAMKSLLKSGDTDKIIFFAGVSRQKEVYVMAANYLQALDWQNKPEVLKNIVSFYAKGRAYDLLANFYVACAQVEIDEFQNYEKALGALGEAGRCLAKASPDQNLVENLAQRQTLVKRFIDCQRTMERDFNGGIMQCRQLLQAPEIYNPVRRGDIYSLMISSCVNNGDFMQAKSLLNELRNATPGGNITYYVSAEVLQLLANAIGVDISELNPSHYQLEDDTEEEIQEMI